MACATCYAYTYDDLGRVTSVDNNGTPGVSRVVLSSQYDSMNDRTQFAATIAGTADLLNTYQYDADRRLTQLVQQGQSGGNTVAVKGANLSYNALGQLSSIFRANFFGVGPQPDIATSAFSYDAGNRLTEIAYTYNGGTAIDAYSWTYDAANRVTSMTTTTDGTANYSYDDTSQVAGASYTGTGQPANESYTYDSNGNRTNTGYSTGTNNRLASDGTFNYAYDAEGNRTSRTRISNAPANDYLTTYTWDYRDRLTDVDFYNNSSVLTSHVHYTYDVFDHRISKSLDSTGSASYSRTEDYVYDGNHVVLDFLDPDGAGPAPLALATRYLNGPGNAAATDQVFAQEAAATGDVLWLLADNLGTTRDVVNNSSTVLGHLVYNSFGQLADGPTNLTRFLYTGQEWDADAGLQYNDHRWYDPGAGRWISQDPMGFSAGDANVSRYVGNRPTNLGDPSGLLAPLVNPAQAPPPAVAPFFGPPAPPWYMQWMNYGVNIVSGMTSGAAAGGSGGAVTGAAAGAPAGGVGAGPGAVGGAIVGAVVGALYGAAEGWDANNIGANVGNSAGQVASDTVPGALGLGALAGPAGAALAAPAAPPAPAGLPPGGAPAPADPGAPLDLGNFGGDGAQLPGGAAGAQLSELIAQEAQLDAQVMQAYNSGAPEVVVESLMDQYNALIAEIDNLLGIN